MVAWVVKVVGRPDLRGVDVKISCDVEGVVEEDQGKPAPEMDPCGVQPIARSFKSEICLCLCLAALVISHLVLLKAEREKR